MTANLSTDADFARFAAARKASVETDHRVASNDGRTIVCRRMAMIRGSNVAHEEYGINDVTTGRTLAQIQADKIALWTGLVARGMKVFTQTLGPVVSSTTDLYATTGGQTTHANNAVRVNLNDWTRDGAPMLNGVAVAVGSSAAGTLRIGQVGHPVTAYFEIADIVESSRNSGVFKVTGASNYATSDGTHPTLAMHTLMAAGINVAAFTAAAAA